MSEYSQSYMAFAGGVVKANKELIQQWARDGSNTELAESCKMLIEAAGEGR